MGRDVLRAGDALAGVLYWVEVTQGHELTDDTLVAVHTLKIVYLPVYIYHIPNM